MRNIEQLKWDSCFFNMRIGRILIQSEEDFEAEIFKNEALQNFDLVYVFSYEKMLTQRQIRYANLDLVDVMLTMSKPFEKKEYATNDYDFRNYLSKSELHDCYSIAENTSTVSRFFTEETIGPQKTKLLYRKWIDNAVQKSFSDGLFLAKENEKVVGVHLIKVDEKNKEGIFTLTGVNPNYKRSGLGRKLWEQSFGFFSNETEIISIKSVFSLKNTDSFNFHLKMGFNKIEETKYIYHFRNR